MISNIILFIALSALVTYCIIWFVSVYCNSKLYFFRRIFVYAEKFLKRNALIAVEFRVTIN